MDDQSHSRHVVVAPWPARPRGGNAQVIDRELAWLEAAIAARLGSHIGGGRASASLPEPPSIARKAGAYARLLEDTQMDAEGRLVLALALAPHLAPEVLDPFLLQNQATLRRFSEFGGLTGQSHAGFLPTVQTALFLLAGTDRMQRLGLRDLFSPAHPLIARGLLALDHRHPEEPPMSAGLRLPRQALHDLVADRSEIMPPDHDFPASRITTKLEWHDLVLDEATLRQVETIGLWVRHANKLMHDWGLERRLKPGYRCLFYGSPGTGKTLTACLLGKKHGLPVWRVDLSRVVSKWIGETEKNLASLFDQAQDRNWILFFDEAEALFSPRTESHTANDRAANQQIAYLLQRLEEFPGLAVLATNQRAHLDEAFSRRFQSSIRFPMPDARDRLRLWRTTFSGKGVTLAPEVNFAELAERHELAGGAIVNVLRYASLMAAERDPPVILGADLMEGVRQELHKDGRYLTR
jgi:AAA+ superfamily predicted ATPase